MLILAGGVARVGYYYRNCKSKRMDDIYNKEYKFIGLPQNLSSEIFTAASWLAAISDTQRRFKAVSETSKSNILYHPYKAPFP